MLLFAFVALFAQRVYSTDITTAAVVDIADNTAVSGITQTDTVAPYTYTITTTTDYLYVQIVLTNDQGVDPNTGERPADAPPVPLLLATFNQDPEVTGTQADPQGSGQVQDENGQKLGKPRLFLSIPASDVTQQCAATDPCVLHIAVVLPPDGTEADYSIQVQEGTTPFCPNDCNGNGDCLDDGTCKCDDGFIDEDCSVAATLIRVGDKTDLTVTSDAITLIYFNVTELQQQPTEGFDISVEKPAGDSLGVSANLPSDSSTTVPTNGQNNFRLVLDESGTTTQFHLGPGNLDAQQQGGQQQGGQQHNRLLAFGKQLGASSVRFLQTQPDQLEQQQGLPPPLLILGFDTNSTSAVDFSVTVTQTPQQPPKPNASLRLGATLFTVLLSTLLLVVLF